MLDVPSSWDSSESPFRVHQSMERPQEVPQRTRDAWMQGYLDHAKSRPRFMPTMSLPPRQKRTPAGSGAHLGRMTLDPAVTAFSLAAARPFEAARDANIKAYHCGVMSFCVLQALEDLQYRCTFEQLFEKAVWRLDDIRAKYMPMMDQTIQMSFCPNSAPSEVVVFDERYAPVAQHRLSQMAPSPQNRTSGAMSPQPVRESSTEFVPSPMYHLGVEESDALSVGIVYVQIFSCHNLRDPGPQCDPFVKLRVGPVEHQSQVISNNRNPTWSDDQNKFTFKSKDCQSDSLIIEVCNAYGERRLGHVAVPLRSLPLCQWQETRQHLSDGAEIEFRVALYPENATKYGSQRPSPSPPRTIISPQRPESPKDTFEEGDNIFGKPNLFSAMPDLLSQLAKDPQLDGLGREPSRNPSLTGWHTSLTREPSQGFSGFGLTGLTPPSFGFTPTSPPFSALSTSQPSVAAPAPRMASRTAPLEGFFSCGGAAPAAAPVAAPVASAVTCSVPCSTTMPVLQGMTSAPSVPSYGTTTSSAFTPYTTPPTYTTLGSYAPQASAYVGNAASTGSTTYTMCPSGVYNGQLQTPSYQPSYRVIG